MSCKFGLSGLLTDRNGGSMQNKGQLLTPTIITNHPNPLRAPSFSLAFLLPLAPNLDFFDAAADVLPAVGTQTTSQAAWIPKSAAVKVPPSSASGSDTREGNLRTKTTASAMG